MNNSKATRPEQNPVLPTFLKTKMTLECIGYFQLDELCLFKVKDGKIVREEYFY